MLIIDNDYMVCENCCWEGYKIIICFCIFKRKVKNKILNDEWLNCKIFFLIFEEEFEKFIWNDKK